MKSILVIEDDQKMRNGLGELLTDEGYQVEFAENGRSGLDRIMKKDFDIVLTDLIMPEVGGLDVLRETKRMKPKTHVIMITAFATVENAVEAMKAGASDYITKPFKIDEVQTKIRTVLAEAEFNKNLHTLDTDVIKAISNPIRKDVVKLLDTEKKLKFTEIQRKLDIDDATKLSFHLRVLKTQAIIDQDSEKVYALTSRGKKLFDALKSLNF